MYTDTNEQMSNQSVINTLL